MGAACCYHTGPATHGPELLEGLDLDPRVGIMDPEDRAEAVRIFAEAFGGTREHPGMDAGTAWTLGGTGGLATDWDSEYRKQFHKFGATMTNYGIFTLGLPIALKEDGKLVGFMYAVPPGYRTNADIGSSLSCCFISGIVCFMCCSSDAVWQPSGRPDVDARNKVLEKAMNEVGRPLGDKKPWYLWVVAVDPAQQGKGYGSILMNTINKLADRNGDPIFLETCGEDHERYYNKRGFEVIERFVMSDKDLEAVTEKTPDATFLGMLRPGMPGGQVAGDKTEV